MDERKATAADPTGLRFDHVQDQKRGNRRIRRRPAFGHHPVPCLRRQGICRDDHAFLCCHKRFCAEAWVVLRFRLRLGQDRRHQQKGCEEGNHAHS